MAAGSSPATTVVDLEALTALERLPRDAARVVVTFQASPARRAVLSEHFPRATFVDAVPSLDGPWQAAVERDLDRLARLDAPVEGVPILDCFRAAWRDELAALHALRWALDGYRRVVTVAGTRSATTLSGVLARGGLDALDLVPGTAMECRPSLLARIRAAGPRGLALALSARLDPSHGRRARLRRRPRLLRVRSVIASSYVNATRAAAQALRPDEPALLVRTGPGATRGIELPRNVRALSLAACLGLDRENAARARDAAASHVLSCLAEWDRGEAAWAPWAALRATSFGSHLLRVLVPEIVSTTVAMRAVLTATGAERLVVGDEFSFADRACIHAARALGVRTVSRQHGILDSHYLRDALLADEHLAWEQAAVDWLREHGAVGTREVRVLPRPPGTAASSGGADPIVVVFLQPTDLVRVAFSDWVRETVAPVVRAASGSGVRVFLKPHPLQTAYEVSRALPVEMRAGVTIVADRSAPDLLAEAAVAVTLDSSVAVDCRDAGVPCLSTAWYPGTYVESLVRMGYLVPCRSPEAMEAALRTRLADFAARHARAGESTST